MVNIIRLFVNSYLILSTLTHVNPESLISRDIDKFMELRVANFADTVQWGKQFTFDLVFYNKSDVPVKFFPKGTIFMDIYSSEVVFDGSSLQRIDSEVDFINSIEIAPKCSHTATYHLNIEYPPFRRGLNQLEVYYVMNLRIKGKLKDFPDETIKRITGIKCGRLESSVFTVYVKP